MVIVLQCARILNRSIVKTLSNSLYASCLSINADILEVDEFIRRMERNLIKILVPSKSSVTNRSTHSEYANFTPNTEINDLAELHEIDEETFCVVIATVHKLITNYNWFFYACKRCSKKVEPSVGVFNCYNCSLAPVSVEPRFKVYFRSMDDTGCTSLVLFNKDVSQLIGKTADELLKDLDEKGLNGTFPVELDWFVGRKFLFKFHMSKYNLTQSWNINTVKKVSANEKSIKEIEDRNSSSKDEIMLYYTNQGVCGDVNALTHIEKDKGASSSVCDNQVIEPLNETPKTKETFNGHDGDNETKSKGIIALDIIERHQYEEKIPESKRKASTTIVIDDENDGIGSSSSSSKLLKKVKIEPDSE